MFLKALIHLSLYSPRPQSRRHLCSFLLRPCNCKCVKLCNVPLQLIVVCLLIVKSGVLGIQIPLNNLIQNSWRMPTPLLYQMLYSATNIAWILNTTLNMANIENLQAIGCLLKKRNCDLLSGIMKLQRTPFLKVCFSWEKKKTCNVLFIFICFVFFPWAACCC